MLHSVRPGPSCGDLWHGAHDRPVPGGPGDGGHYPILLRPDRGNGYRAARRDDCGHQGGGLFREHPPVGGDVAGLPVHLGAVPGDDPDGVQPVFQIIQCVRKCGGISQSTRIDGNSAYYLAVGKGNPERQVK